MKDEMTCLRERLEQLSTQHLDRMLQEELRRRPIDDDAVRMIMGVLKEREKDYPLERSAETEAAWEDYRRNIQRVSVRPPGKVNRVIKAASVAAILVALYLAVPQKAEAQSFFTRLVRWTDSFFELFNPDQSEDSHAEYIFKAEHPGLQKVHDVLTELGVTGPAVPMWLPEEYELVECKVTQSPTKMGLTAEFTAFDSNNMVFSVDIYSQNVSYEYYKDSSQVETLEIDGISHNIMRNNETWIAVWTKDNLECSIFIDCQEDTLHNILSSIYMMEDQ